MSAGPYPTKAMHQDMLAGNYTHVARLLDQGLSPTPSSEVRQVKVSLRGVALRVAGLMVFTGPQASPPALEMGISSPDFAAGTLGSMIATLVVRPNPWDEGWTEVVVPQTRWERGVQTHVDLNLYVPRGVSVGLLADRPNWPAGLEAVALNGSYDQLPGYPALDVLEEPLEGLAVVRVPTAPTAVMRRLTEVVWPLGGPPYLHLVEPAPAGEEGAHYHLPLTPGLPQ